ncbi:MAG: DMT family transporter [Pseudomonadota bacterium]
MNLRDFSLLFVVCFLWGLNVVLTRWVIADMSVPPIFYAALRFGLIALLLIPFLRPVPKKIGQLFLIAMGIGAAHFAFLFLGLQTAEASAAAVATQLGVPFSTLLSMVFLGEKIGWRRGMGITLAFAGVMVIAFEPSGFAVSVGLLYVVLSTFVGACAGILMKRIDPMPAMQMQAWVGLFSVGPLALISLAVEQGQVSEFIAAGWGVWVATAFAVLAVSIFGHGSFYMLLKRYDVTVISPLTLMTPIWSVALGVALLSEALTVRLVVGTAIALIGVGAIAMRPNVKLPVAALGRKLFQ